MPCEKYLISVGIVGPVGPGPLTRTPMDIDTQYNENKPPRNVRATVNIERHEMDITWEHNCPVIGQYPASYLIKLTELTKNQTATVEVKRKGTKILKHTFENIPRGGVFNVSIATNSKDAEAAVLKVNGPPLAAVRQLKVYPEKNGTYVVYWHEINDNDGP